MGDPEVLVGRYRLVRKLGAGAMGTVWLARDETLERDVAVKQVRYAAHIDEAHTGSYGDLSPEEMARQRALREARLAARLSHPNAASIYDVAVHEGDPWIVMEYVPSRTLTEIVRDHGPIPAERAALLGVQIGGALAEAHRVGIVHRDVKPSNILLTETGEAKITDFGIARGSGDVTLTRTGLLTGTPAYFAPELARGSEPSPRTDVWSLGASLYYAVEGSPPFGTDGNPLVLLGRVANQEVPIPARAGLLTSALMRLLSKDPARRPSMDQARTMLAEVFERTAMIQLPTLDDVPVLEDSTRVQEPATSALETGSSDPVEGTVSDISLDEPALSGSPPPDEPPQDGTTGEPAGEPEPAPTRPVARRPSRTPKRRNIWIAAVAVLMVLAVGGWALVNGQDQPGAKLGTQSPANSQPPDPKPSKTIKPTPTKRSPSQTPRKAKKKRTPKAAMTAPAMRNFLASYYTLLPQQRDAAWRMLTPRMQQQSGGRSTFEGWWSSVSDVQATNVRPDPRHERVTATLRILRKGSWHRENWRFDLVKSPDGSRLLMERGRQA